MQRRLRIDWYLAVALLIAVAAALPLLSLNGFLNTRGGGDSPFLLQRVHQLTVALQDGHFPVRWMPDANYGLGYPFFNFYAPLSIYIAAAFRLLGFPITHAVQASQVIGFVVGAWGMFLLARRWLRNRWAALLASAAYTLAPFHMVNVYVRGDSLAEFWAMAWYPWVLLSADSLLSSPASKRLRPGIALALFVAVLVATHNISALIFLPFLVLFVLLSLFRAWRRREPDAAPARLFAAAAGAALLALALAAWFWLPALAEQELAQLGPVTEGYFNYAQHFWPVTALTQTGLLFDYDVAGSNAFRMGLVQTILIAIGVVGLLVARRRALSTAFILVTLLLSTFMLLPLSRWVWDTLPLLAFTQFPWRFLSVQAFAGALATGGVALLGERLDRHGCAVLGSVAATALLIAALGALRPDFITVRDVDVTAERLMEYEWFSGNIGTTISAEYLPATVQPRLFTSEQLNRETRHRLVALAGEARGQLVPDLTRTQRQVWEVAVASAEATIMLPTVYWPGWQADADGENVSLTPADGSGRMQLTLPEGEHTVTLFLTRTAPRLIGEWASLIALLVVGGLLVWSGQRRGMHWRRIAAGGLTALVVVLVVAGIGRLLREAQFLTGVETRSWNFDKAAYLHHNPAGLIVGSGRLMRYEFDQLRIVQGETVTATFDWVAGVGDATLALVTPAVYRYPDAPAIAESAEPIALGTVTHRLHVPDNAPPGLYLPRLTVGDAVEYLRPLRVVAANEQDASAQFPFEARVVALDGEENGALHLQMAWRTSEFVGEDYVSVVRLLDSRNLFYAQHDAQPGYGFLPTTSWTPDAWVDDWITLRWVTDDDGNVLADGVGPYVLTASLYSAETGAFVFTRRLGEVDWSAGALQFTPAKPVFTLPDGVTPLDATLGDGVGLRAYTLAQSADRIDVSLFWEAPAAVSADYTHFVHLLDADGAIVAQHDGMPRYDTYPTSQWMPGEIVDDPAFLDLANVPPGAYTLVAGLYRAMEDGTFPRLPVRGADAFSADAVLLTPITIE